MSSVILGTDTDTNDAVRIDDIARRSGLYLLGRPGMGKSALAVNIALQDIVNGHGLFFLDPHGEAIADLLRRGDIDLSESRAYLLDVEDEDYSFGINLLQCDNVASRNARRNTYTKAYNVFFKIWEEEFGPWLQLILQNVLRAFIENQDYTLADVPMFLNPRSVEFRNHIVDNIQYEPAVADFWRYEFFERREPDQQARVEAALTRINTLLTDSDVRHIVGQLTTTIDFSTVLSTNKVILLKLSANLAEDAKKFIGTILLSELVHAVRNRPEGDRSQFCVFIDEFHNFASSDHMATMVTEGRKFGVASTFLHVERFGQLAHNQRLLGATQAIVNKVLFQVTVKDADEFAPEFAKTVEPTLKHQEAQLVISPRPVEDIWEKGHPSQSMMDIRNSYFWIVDLLKRPPQEHYFYFDPSRKITIQGTEDGRQLHSDYFEDWPYYTATPDMIRRGISLMNKYYYKWATGQYTTETPFALEQEALVLEIILYLGGLYGFRASFAPLNARLTDVSIYSTYRSSLEWQSRPFDEIEQEIYPGLIRCLLDVKFINSMGKQAIADTFLAHHKNYVIRRSEKSARINFANSDNRHYYTHRANWQIKELIWFIIHGMRSAAVKLCKEPLKVASGNYEETLRVERPQHDLVTDMVLELTRLPRFNAYAKIIDDRTHRIQTHPLPKITNPDTVDRAIANGHTLCKDRDAIDAEIRERQNRWGRGSEPPPQARRVR